jgi:hypothetical protein
MHCEERKTIAQRFFTPLTRVKKTRGTSGFCSSTSTRVSRAWSLKGQHLWRDCSCLRRKRVASQRNRTNLNCMKSPSRLKRIKEHNAPPIDLAGADFDKVLKKMLQTPPPPKAKKGEEVVRPEELTMSDQSSDTEEYPWKARFIVGFIFGSIFVFFCSLRSQGDFLPTLLPALIGGLILGAFSLLFGTGFLRFMMEFLKRGGV